MRGRTARVTLQGHSSARLPAASTVQGVMLLHSGESSKASSPLQAHWRENPALGSAVGSASGTTALPAQRSRAGSAPVQAGGSPHSKPPPASHSC